MNSAIMPAAAPAKATFFKLLPRYDVSILMSWEGNRWTQGLEKP